MGRDRAAHDLFYLVLAEWESWAAEMIHDLGDILGSCSPVRLSLGDQRHSSFLESTLLPLPTCPVPIYTEIQHIQPHQSPGCRELSG